MSHIFISYSRKDTNIVDKIASALKRAGFNLWLDRGNIEGGDLWDDCIAQAIIDSDIFVVALSPNAVESKNVIDEIVFACDEHKRIIPVYIKSVILPANLRLRLSRIQFIDMSNWNGARNHPELVKLIKSISLTHDAIRQPESSGGGRTCSLFEANERLELANDFLLQGHAYRPEYYPTLGIGGISEEFILYPRLPPLDVAL